MVSITKKRFKNNQLTEEQSNLLLEIDENIFDSKNKTWNESLQELKDWIASNNRTPMSRESTWLTLQKINFKKNQLTEEQINLLLEIDENIFDDKLKTWNESLQELKDWIASNNRMPKSRESTWLESQKYRFKNSQLTEEQSNLLLEIDENIFDSKNKTWNESLQELKDWIASNNRTPMSRESAWLASQKKWFKNNQLTEEQINLLLEIDENIFDDKFKTWNESLQELKDWIASNNRMPTNKESAWLASQKKRFKNNQLTEEQSNLLLEIDENIFDSKNKTWNESLQELKDWIASNNRTPMSRESTWLAYQKKRFKNNQLTEKQINLLLALDKNIFDYINQITKKTK